MRVKDIRQMLKAYKPDDELIIGWWDREWFDGFAETKLTDEQWEEVLLDGDRVLEYSGLGDLMINAMTEAGVKTK